MNVRWDAVVGQDTFWSTPAAAAASSTPAARTSAGPHPVAVEVSLYGMLAVALGERTLKFELPGDAVLADVIGELQRRLGPEVLRGIVGPNGEMNRCCRVFVNGAQAEDPATPVRQGGAAATLEIILLVAIEGG
jgi:hypothetical protein